MSFEATVTSNPTTESAPSITQIELPLKGAPTQATAAPETPAAPVVEETPKQEAPKELDSSRLALFAKKESKLQKIQAEIKAERQAIEERAALVKAYEEAKANALKDPIKALESLGLTYKQITDFVLNGNEITPELDAKSVRDELASFKKQQEEERQKALEEEKQRIAAEEKAAMDGFVQEINDFVGAHKDEYELINTFNQQGLIITVIEQQFQATQKILSPKEAADLVEEELENEGKKFLATKKYQAKATPQPQAAPKQSQPAQQRTLNNQMHASIKPRSAPLTEKERIARAMAALDRK